MKPYNEAKEEYVKILKDWIADIKVCYDYNFDKDTMFGIVLQANDYPICNDWYIDNYGALIPEAMSEYCGGDTSDAVSVFVKAVQDNEFCTVDYMMRKHFFDEAFEQAKEMIKDLEKMRDYWWGLPHSQREALRRIVNG